LQNIRVYNWDILGEIRIDVHGFGGPGHAGVGELRHLKPQIFRIGLK
jgi:hypothetical protein